MKGENFLDKHSKKKEGGTKMSKRLHIYLMLLATTLIFLSGCGGGSDGLNVSEREKTAKVSLSFQFPSEEGEASKSVISNATTHFLVTVDQWQKKKDGTLYWTNKVKSKPISASTPTLTLDLYPDFTNICVTQWSGDPNDIYTSTKLETVCSSGFLNPGSNTVNITMLRGTWTLATPFAFSNTTSLESVILSRKGYPLPYEQQVQSIKDVTYFDSNQAMAKLNWGSDYNVRLQANKAGYYGKGYYAPPFDANADSQSFGFYSNFFGTNGGSSLLIAKNESIVINNVEIPKGYGLFKLPKQTDPDGVYRVSQHIIEKAKNGNKHVLLNPKAAIQILKWDGSGYNNNQTATILDPCADPVAATQLTMCAAKEDSISVGPTFSQYSSLANSYKVISKFSMTGVDICLDQGGGPIFDASNNLTGCYSYNAWVNYNPSATLYCLSGTWNSSSNRCELSLQDACAQIGGIWEGYGCRVDNNYYYDNSLCGMIPAGPNMYNYYNYSPPMCANNGIQGTIQCDNGGTYTNFRCEADLQTTCYEGTQDPGEYYDPATKTCTYTNIAYVGGINFTPVTLTGVGKFPATIDMNASKVSTKSAKFKINLKK